MADKKPIVFDTTDNVYALLNIDENSNPDTLLTKDIELDSGQLRLNKSHREAIQFSRLYGQGPTTQGISWGQIKPDGTFERQWELMKVNSYDFVINQTGHQITGLGTEGTAADSNEALRIKYNNNLATFGGDIKIKGDRITVHTSGNTYDHKLDFTTPTDHRTITFQDGSGTVAFLSDAPATNLSYTASTRLLESSTGTDVTLPEVVAGGNSGLITGADKTKIDGIEAGATGDQTAAEIRTLVDAASDSNVFTDADHTKLDGIAAGAEVNVATNLSYTASSRELASSTGTNVTLPEVSAGGDSGLMTGADKTKLDGLQAGQGTTNLTYTASTRVIASSSGTDATLPNVTAGGDSGLMTGADKTKLDGVNADNYLKSNADDTFTGTITGNTLLLGDSQITSSTAKLQVNGFSRQGTIYLHDLTNGVDSPLKNVNGELIWNTDVIWHEGNDANRSVTTLAKFFQAATAFTNFSQDVGFTSYYGVANGPTNYNYHSGFRSLLKADTKYGWELVGVAENNITEDLYVRKINNQTYGNWSRIWTEASDGSGTGLDADLLDGQHGSYYLNASNFNAGTISDARIPDTITPITLVTTKEVRTSNGTELVLNAGESAGKISGQTGEVLYVNAEGGLEVSSPTSANSNWQGGTAYHKMRILGNEIQFHNGTTRVGEINTTDTTWLRINQTTAKNIYTPRYIRADGGFFVDGTTKGINGSGNFIGGTIAGASDYGTLLRSDSGDTYDGSVNGRVLRFASVAGRTANTTSGNQFPLEVFQGTVNADAAMTFHIGNDHARYFGLDGTTNDLFTGGWSAGATKHKIWHAGNDGSGSGLDADLFDGKQRPLNFGNDAYSGSPYTSNVNADNNRIVGSSVFMSSSSNTPTNGSGHLWTVAGGDTSNRGIQFFSQNSNNGSLWMRCLNGKTWRKVWTAGNHGGSSGLDADLLDGQHGSYYRNAGNINAGTLNSARLPSTMGRTTFNAGVKITGLFNDTQTTHLVLEGGDPTITFSDNSSGADDFYIHINSNNFYILTDRGGGAGAWETPHPLQLEADTNDAYIFGRRIIDGGNFSVNGTAFIGGATTVSTSSDQKIILQGSNQPYIRWRKGTTDKAYIQYRGDKTYSDLLMKNQQNGVFTMESGGNMTCVLALVRNDSTVGSGNDTAQLVFGHTDGNNDWPDGQTATLMPCRIVAEASETQGTGDDGHRLRFYTKDTNRDRTQTSQEAFRAEQNQRVYFYNSHENSSDARIKDNVAVLENCLDKVLQLRGVEYDRIDLSRPQHDYGLIAQEVEPIFPVLVGESNQVDREDGIEDLKTLNYEGLIPVLIEAVKEQNAIIQSLQSRIEVLESSSNPPQ